MSFPTVYVALGANLGARLDTLRRAVQCLPSLGVDIEARSSVYESDYVGSGERQPAYLNAVVRGRSSVTPLQLLDALQGLEGQFGRRPHGHLRPRPLDLDILYFGEHWIRHPRLIVPHPRLEERLFVLQPLLELGCFEGARQARVRRLVDTLTPRQRLVRLGRLDQGLDAIGEPRDVKAH